MTSEDIQKLKEDLQKSIEQQTIKLEELEKLIFEIQSKLEEQEQEDELEALLATAEQLGAQEKEEEEGVGMRFFSGLRQMQVLNPNVSLLGEFYGGVSSSKNDLIIKPDGRGSLVRSALHPDPQFPDLRHHPQHYRTQAR